MRTPEFVPPEYKKEAFNCPHCRAYSHQLWTQTINMSNTIIQGVDIAVCTHCKELSIWFNGVICFPDTVAVSAPNEDLSEEIKKDYLEAASILDKSPRGSAALLRLAIQKICKELGENGSNINDDIAALVQKGLPTGIQKALDTVRVIGNESVHPGTIDLRDNRDIAVKLFELVNIIAQVMITNPKDIEGLFDSLPEEKKDAISRRDSTT